MEINEKMKKILKIVFLIILILAVIIASFFIWKSTKNNQLDTVVFSEYEFDNTKTSSKKNKNQQNQSESNIENENSQENNSAPIEENRKEKDIDFKVKLSLPYEIKNILTVTNIPPLETDDVLYEFNITQNTGKENIVIYKFYIYRIEDYETLSENMKETRFLLKRFDEYGYCLAYETMPVNFGDNEELWNDYNDIYNSLEKIVSDIIINKK